MMFKRWAAVPGVLLAFAVTGCGGSAPSPDPSGPVRVSQSPSTGTGAASLTAADRIDFGCSLARGANALGPRSEHYSNYALGTLFQAALETDRKSQSAAKLWNASDRLKEDESGASRDAVLRLCAEGGYEGAPATWAGLRAYACKVVAALQEQRPDLDSFGPKSTKVSPGDPARTDAAFVDFAFLMVALDKDPTWLGDEQVGMALGDEDAEGYRAALSHGAAVCSEGIDTAWLEDEIAPQIDQQSGNIIGKTITGSVVDCPASVEWRAGSTFRCDVIAPEFPPGYIEVTVEADGRYRWFATNNDQ